jgi:hypothetical protein
MKTTELTPVRVFRDENYEAKTKVELQSAKIALQKIVDTWNGLEIGPVTDLSSLVLNPEQAYKEALNKNIEVPVQPGKYQISKDVWIQTLSIPVPDLLYTSCRDARKNQYTMMPELWSIIEGEAILNESEAEVLTDSRSIYVNTPEKVKLAEDILRYIELTNLLSAKCELLSGSPSVNNFFIGKFHLTQKSYPGPFTLELIPDKLREWLQ